LEFGRIHSYRIETPDQAAHTRPADVINRYAVFLQPLDDPDMGQAERAPALKRQADSRPCHGRRILRQPL
jgi:hypothetical protein